MNKSNLLKKLLMSITILSILYTFFTNVSSSQKLDNLAYVVAIGIEKGSTENYRLSFQISTVESSSSEESSGDSGDSSKNSDTSIIPSYVVNTVECSSIDMGIGLMNSYMNKPINLSHCKVIVFSEEIAKKGIRSLIYTFVNKIEIRPDCNIIVSKIPEGEFKEKDAPTLDDLLPRYFTLNSNTSDEETGYSESVTLNEFYAYLEDPLKQPYCAIGAVSNPQKILDISDENAVEIDKAAGSINSKDEKILLELLGLAIFNDDKMVGDLSRN